MDETIPLVDGLRLTEPADDAGRGEVWRARVTGGLGGEHGVRLPGELPGVGECLVRLLRLPVDDALRSRAQAVASDLLTLDDPGLLGIRAVRPAFDGVALVLAPVPSPALPLHLLARRRQLSAGEVVTLGVALAWALAAAHAAGVTHGRLRDADVLLAADGRPLLTGVGVMGVLGAAGEPIDDVRALERLLASLLDLESVKAPRVRAALDGRAVAAGELAARLADAAPAAVIRVDDASAADGPVDMALQRPARRPARFRFRFRRSGLVVVSGLAIVLLAGVVGWVSAPSPKAGAPGRRVPARLGPAPVDWTGVLTRLDAARAAAFAGPGIASLAAADAPSTPAYRYDAAAVAALRSRGAKALGLQMLLDRVAVASATDRRVTLAVTDRRRPYQLRDGQGRVLARVAGRGSARHLIELSAVGPPGHAQWRVAQVSELAIPSG